MSSLGIGAHLLLKVGAAPAVFPIAVACCVDPGATGEFVVEIARSAHLAAVGFKLG